MPSRPAPVAEPQGQPTGSGAAAFLRPVILRKRADFLRAAKARRQGTAGFLLQARQRDTSEADPQDIRIGYTCSKKLGNAVARNRAKRRLREVARAILPKLGRPGWDYVLIGRPETTISRPFTDLLADLEQALTRIHGDRP
ncbi:MAG: ribonuclease P protein component [Paracoccus sp. (in: a-proteobacteria)]|uniref:ribonuclease P protein component n=1 Tax=Paracoccus sp. TaxID=267 RepID=UPI0026E02308|nr:ribonuclease P protein component [Paracoccus sp. (in: a-proteobacteria)]MDO5620735.1 ribonuclease P protein component [Paracoccus sp. (in: a-proteobacteria)]